MNAPSLLNTLKKYTLLLVILTLTFSLSVIYFAENLRLTSKVTDSTLPLSFNVQAPPPAPTPSPGPSGGGGGGGGGVSVSAKPTDEFQLSPQIIKISVKQGETKKSNLIIKNLAGTTIDVLLRIIGFDPELVTFPTGLQDYSLTLLKNQELVIPIIATIPSPHPVGLDSGTITASTAQTQKDIALFLEIKPAAALLDSSITILPNYKHVKRGAPFYATLALKSLGPPGRVDVQVIYGLRDSKGNDYELRREVLAVETQTEVVRVFLVPYNIPPGPYGFYTKISYQDIQDISIDTFEVSKEALPLYERTILLLIILLAFALGILFLYTLFHLYIIYPYTRIIRPRAKVKKAPRPRKDQENILEQLRTLEESYRAGLISERAYHEDKERLEKILRRP